MSDSSNQVDALADYLDRVAEARASLDGEIARFLNLVGEARNLRRGLGEFLEFVEQEIANSPWDPPVDHPLRAEHERREMLRQFARTSCRFADAAIRRIPPVPVHVSTAAGAFGSPQNDPDLPEALSSLTSAVRNAAGHLRTAVFTELLIPQCFTSMSARLWEQQTQLAKITNSVDVSDAPAAWLETREAVWRRWNEILNERQIWLEIPAPGTPFDDIRHTIQQVDGETHDDIVGVVLEPGLCWGEQMLSTVKVAIGANYHSKGQSAPEVAPVGDDPEQRGPQPDETDLVSKTGGPLPARPLIFPFGCKLPEPTRTIPSATDVITVGDSDPRVDPSSSARPNVANMMIEASAQMFAQGVQSGDPGAVQAPTDVSYEMPCAANDGLEVDVFAPDSANEGDGAFHHSGFRDVHETLQSVQDESELDPASERPVNDGKPGG